VCEELPVYAKSAVLALFWGEERRERRKRGRQAGVVTGRVRLARLTMSARIARGDVPSQTEHARDRLERRYASLHVRRPASSPRCTLAAAPHSISEESGDCARLRDDNP
jgi:hypothetical protein